jgi:hypothetical protein
MLTITVHLNEARGASFDGLTPSQAELVDAGTYTLPATQYIAHRFIPGMTDDESVANQELYVADVLNHVYEQLNVGGDLIPAEEFTTAYRAAGHRSLSVGDLVTIEDEDYLGYRGTHAVERYGFKKVPGANIVIRRGLARYADSQGAVL